MAARVLAIMNQKGGVGKTTTALNLGAALAQAGRRVLLVDLDPQANLTRGVNRQAADLSQSIYEYLTNPACDPRPIVQATAYDNLFLVPSHIDLSGAELEMVTMIGRETRLKGKIDLLRDAFDYILVDCLPSLSLLTLNAMVACDEVIVPLQAHPFALEGLGKLFEIVAMIRDALNPAIAVTGVMVTLYDSRTNVSRETMDRLRQDPRLAPHLFETLVRMNIKIAESQKDGIPVIHYDRACAGAQAYLALCEELLEMRASGCLASVARRRIRERGGESEAARNANDDASESGQRVSAQEAEAWLARLVQDSREAMEEKRGEPAPEPEPELRTDPDPQPESEPHPEPEPEWIEAVAAEPIRGRLGGRDLRARLGLSRLERLPVRR